MQGDDIHHQQLQHVINCRNGCKLVLQFFDAKLLNLDDFLTLLKVSFELEEGGTKVDNI